MSTQLRIRSGQYSDKGRKALNQDFHAVLAPNEPQLSAKGASAVLADGISSSDVSQIASATAVQSFLDDYYATPETWSVKTAVQRVMRATNSWLYAQTRNGPHRYNLDKGYVCTFSALIIKSATAHLFHVGDSRIYAVCDQHLEPLTEDHRLRVSREKSYLSRALGMRDHLEIDYLSRPVEVGDLFLLATDGVYEFMDEACVMDALKQHPDDLDLAARHIADAALNKGSDDNLTIQLVRVDELPPPEINELQEQATHLPFPPELRPRMSFDGYTIQRELYHSPRSHVYLAIDEETQQRVILKTPSMDLRDDHDYIERFLMEDWVARRIDNEHVLKVCDHKSRRNYLYLVTEYIEGQTLAQWMIDNPEPDLEEVRQLVGQIAKGLRALHRLEMLHQDLRPANIMINKAGTVKIIDFGSARVAGVAELSDPGERQQILGTAQYTAPEYFSGHPASIRSDQFSLGVITYQMLTGGLPYGTAVSRATSKSAQRKLRYQSAREHKRTIPTWVDEAIRTAVKANPWKRYTEISEFIHDLHKPNPAFLHKERPPLIERNPLAFWQGLSALLFLIILALLQSL